jgi:gluconolactonase
MPAKVEKITESVELGEGPHWDVATQSLYFVDIFGKAIYKYNPSAERLTKAVIGECQFNKQHFKDQVCVGTNHVTFIIPIEGQKNKFLISIGRTLAIVTWGWRK